VIDPAQSGPFGGALAENTKIRKLTKTIFVRAITSKRDPSSSNFGSELVLSLTTCCLASKDGLDVASPFPARKPDSRNASLAGAFQLPKTG